MSVNDRRRKLMYDDLVKMPDDGKRHEIIHVVPGGLNELRR